MKMIVLQDAFGYELLFYYVKLKYYASRAIQHLDLRYAVKWALQVDRYIS